MTPFDYPKLDERDCRDKLTEIIRNNNIKRHGSQNDSSLLRRVRKRGEMGASKQRKNDSLVLFLCFSEFTHLILHIIRDSLEQ